MVSMLLECGTLFVSVVIIVIVGVVILCSSLDCRSHVCDACYITWLGNFYRYLYLQFVYFYHSIRPNRPIRLLSLQ